MRTFQVIMTADIDLYIIIFSLDFEYDPTLPSIAKVKTFYVFKFSLVNVFRAIELQKYSMQNFFGQKKFGTKIFSGSKLFWTTFFGRFI